MTHSPSSIFVPSEAFKWLIAAVAVFAFGQADAQWTFEPEVGVGVERDDNAKLSTRTDDILDVTGFLADGEVRANYESELSNFWITPRIVSRTYDDASEIDSTDYFVDALYRRNTEFNTFRFRLNFEDESARTGERNDTDLDVDDPSDIPDDDTGLVRFEGRRDRLRLRPEWIHRFNEVSSVGALVNYLDVSYDEDLQFALKDFTDTRFELSYNRAFSERTVGILTGTGRLYDVPSNAVETKGYGVLAGFEHQLSETTRTKVLLGIEDTDSNVNEADATPIGEVSLRRRGETVNVLAQYRRSVSASGSGKLSTRDSLNLNLSRRLNERVTAGLGVRAYQTNSLIDGVTDEGRNYVQLRAQFVWNFTSSFASEVNYRYTFQKRDALEESANSNQVTIWFVYRPNSVDRRFGSELDL
jgi:hypothetical protein